MAQRETASCTCVLFTRSAGRKEEEEDASSVENCDEKELPVEVSIAWSMSRRSRIRAAASALSTAAPEASAAAASQGRPARVAAFWSVVGNRRRQKKQTWERVQFISSANGIQSATRRKGAKRW